MKSLRLKNQSLFVKMVIPITVLFAVCLMALSWYLYQDIADGYRQKSIDQALQIAEKEGIAFMEGFNNSVMKVEGIKNSVEGLIAIDKQNPDNRAVVIDAMKRFLKDAKGVMGIWICFEPNAFDGLDAQFKNANGYHDATGRFIPYVANVDGSVVIEPLVAYDVEGDGDYYLKALQTGQDQVIDPYEYTVGGKTILLSTYSMPIKVDGKTIGVIGFDVDTSLLQEYVANLEVFDGEGYAFALTQQGVRMAHPNKELLGKPTEDKGLLEASQDARPYSAERVSQLGFKSLTVISPFRVGNTSIKGSFGVVVPASVVYREANDALNLFITCSLLVLAVGIVGMFGIARLITTPINKLVRYATAIAEGDFSVTSPLAQTDETGKVCKAMEEVHRQLTMLRNGFDRISGEIGRGELTKARGREELFEGDWKAIITSFNSVLRNMRGHIDSFPVPYMIVNNNLEIQYMNKQARNTSGVHDYTQKSTLCSDAFKSNICNTPDCACKKTIRKNEDNNTAATCIVNGEEMFFDVLSTPIRDEHGNVVGACEILVDQTTIIRARNLMQQASGDAMAVADRVASAAEELSAQMEQVRGGADLQRNRVDETATAMEQMTATVREVAANVAQASARAQEARQKATEGADIVNKTVEAIAQVKSTSEELQQSMGQLEEQATSIGSVMNVINDIADQTNLLALNAAIEAARAGEAGRGFAVVADEVRKLAEQTMKATNDVGQHIRQIQSASQVNMKNMSNAAEIIESATEYAYDSGKALNEILEMVSDSESQMQGIASASEEQATTSDQINLAVVEITRIADETAVGTNESATAISEVQELASSLKKITERLATS